MVSLDGSICGSFEMCCNVKFVGEIQYTDWEAQVFRVPPMCSLKDLGCPLAHLKHRNKHATSQSPFIVIFTLL